MKVAAAAFAAALAAATLAASKTIQIPGVGTLCHNVSPTSTAKADHTGTGGGGGGGGGGGHSNEINCGFYQGGVVCGLG